VPIYEYTCGKCNTKFEELVRTMAEEAAPACPSCGSKKTERAMSVFAVSEGSSKPPACRGCTGGPCPME